jgi:hypothetical protein
MICANRTRSGPERPLLRGPMSCMRDKGEHGREPGPGVRAATRADARVAYRSEKSLASNGM